MRCQRTVAECHQPMEFIIMEQTKELLSVPLASLVPSRFNVRRHSVGQVEELAALIEAQGLLHNLVVTEQEVGRGKSRKMKFAVAAGERRRRAMLLLQQRGRLPKEHEVLCELVPPERALEVSLAENSGREAMHPADEFEAFKALIDEGKGVEDVAARFGVSVLTVQRRLKLSALSPRLLVLYREDGINLDQLMALTLSDDHAVQERTWFDAQPWDKTPAALRRRLTVGEVEAAGSALVRFIGIEAYEAAGGVVRRDLFDDEQSRFLSDPALLERLAAEKLEALAGTVREEGWKWVEARLSVDSQALRQLAPCAHVNRKPTAAEQEELDALDRRAAELDQQAQALDDAPEWSPDEAEMIDLEEQDIAARRKAIQEALKTWTPKQKGHAGVIVTIGRDGDVEVMRGLVRVRPAEWIAALMAARTVTTWARRRHRQHRNADRWVAAKPLPSGSPRIERWPCRRCWRRTLRWPWHRWCMSSCCVPSGPTTRAKRRRCRCRRSCRRMPWRPWPMTSRRAGHGRPCSRRRRHGRPACPSTSASGSGG